LNGAAWTEVTSLRSALPTPTAHRFVSIAAVRAFSDKNVFVEAWVSTDTRDVSAVVVHWNGATWKRVKPWSAG
jgi:hypothetical protein